MLVSSRAASSNVAASVFSLLINVCYTHIHCRITRFSRYRLARKLNTDDGEVQVSALIYAMGIEAEHIYKSMTFATLGTNPEDANDYDTVLQKFEAYLTVMSEMNRFETES